MGLIVVTSVTKARAHTPWNFNSSPLPMVLIAVTSVTKFRAHVCLYPHHEPTSVPSRARAHTHTHTHTHTYIYIYVRFILCAQMLFKGLPPNILERIDKCNTV